MPAGRRIGLWLAAGLLSLGCQSGAGTSREPPTAVERAHRAASPGEQPTLPAVAQGSAVPATVPARDAVDALPPASPGAQVFARLAVEADQEDDRLEAIHQIVAREPGATALSLTAPTLHDPSPRVRAATLATVATFAKRTELAPAIKTYAGPELVGLLDGTRPDRDAAYAILTQISGQDFPATSIEAWRTWVAPPAPAGI